MAGSRQFRLLLPWFDQQSAVRLLAGAQPASDASAVAAAQWLRARQKLRARAIETFTTATQPLPANLAPLARDFLAAADLAGNPDFPNAELRLVELSSLLTFQAKLTTDDVRARFLEAYDGSLESIFRICLPVAARMDPVHVMLEGPTARISSGNPNLRFGGFELTGASLVANFGFRPPWVQVVEYRGRLFVRNGYHRCWALLNAGARHVVAIVSKAGTRAELGAAESGYIAEAHLLGSAPPMVADFEDPELYATGVEPATSRVIVIAASESMEPSPR
jgi:hypothetical protein